MEMVEMDATLVKLDYVEGANEVAEWGKEFIESLKIDRSEFLKILEKTEEWNLLDEETRDSISNALNQKAIRKILQIISTTTVVGGLATFGVFGSGAIELYSQFNEEGVPISEIFQSTTFYLYCAKLFSMTLIPYIRWGKDPVKNKILKSAINGFPLIGFWAFSVWTMSGEKYFFKFWKVYGDTRRAYQKAISENSDEAKNNFKEALHEAIEKRFKPSDYRERLLQTINAQGFGVLETSKLVNIEIGKEPPSEGFGLKTSEILSTKKMTTKEVKKLSPNSDTATSLNEILFDLQISSAQTEETLEPVAGTV